MYFSLSLLRCSYCIAFFTDSNTHRKCSPMNSLTDFLHLCMCVCVSYRIIRRWCRPSLPLLMPDWDVGQVWNVSLHLQTEEMIVFYWILLYTCNTQNSCNIRNDNSMHCLSDSTQRALIFLYILASGWVSFSVNMTASLRCIQRCKF